MNDFLKATPLLDFTHPEIQSHIREQKYRDQEPKARIGAIYDYVRELPFGYNLSDDLPASQVLRDGYGQCNTKTTLLMALLRACDIPCRFHGATIHKRLQAGIVPPIAHFFAPQNIVHSWAEVYFEEKWVALEGVICDSPYLDGVRTLTGCSGEYLGYGIGTLNLAAPPIQWDGSDTAIQQTGVNQDFGIFPSPDDFYAKYGVNLRGLRKFLYRHVIRHHMNRRAHRIRQIAEAPARTPPQ